MGNIIRWSVRFFVVVTSMIFVFLLAVTFLQIPLDLTRFKEPLEKLVSKALDRPVVIEKSIIVSTSLKPVFTLGGLRIRNTDEFSQDTFLYLDSARIQVELVPLLKKKLYISDFSVSKLDITLEKNSGGSVNWIFSPVAEDGVEPAAESGVKDATADPAGGAQSFEIVSDTIVVRKLLFENIGVTFYAPERTEPDKFAIEKCAGEMVPGKPLNLDIHGKINTFPYTTHVELASLEEYLTHNKSWTAFSFAIAETEVSFSGDVDFAEADQSLALKAEVSGENLTSFNDLFKLDLPPLKQYRITANLKLKQHQFNLENLEIKTGLSSLNGTARIVSTGEEVSITVNLHSPVVQLDDFIFDDWSWNAPAGEPSTAEGNKMTVEKDKDAVFDNSKPAGSERRKLADPELLAQLEAHIGVKAEKVLSGEDELGSGSLVVTLVDGRLAIEPLKLNLPGGSAFFSASLTPGKQGTKAEVKAVVENFDVGILVRRNKPDSTMEGLVNLDTYLTSTASSLDQVMANGNGYFDFSGQVKNIKAGIIDLWAVNLVAAIVASTDENASQINCAVGRWTVNDGVLVPDAFFIDTTKIRICGSGTVDFKKNMVDLAVSPTAKKPEFFSLATPIAVKGSFSELDFGVKSGSIFGTAVRFVVSPLTVPVKRIFTKNIPKDGSDVCVVQLGAENRAEITVKGCR